MRVGAYKQLITYREMRRWLMQLRIPKTDILLSILWEHSFDHNGIHKQECKLPLKQMFPVRTPTINKEFTERIQRLGILTCKRSDIYVLGDMTKQIFKDAIEEIRMWQSIHRRLKEAEVKVEVLENKTAKALQDMNNNINDLKVRIDVLSGNGLVLTEFDE